MTKHISDETLTAYLDGELTGAVLTQVESALADDPVLQNRLAAIDIAPAEIRAAFDQILPQSPPFPLHETTTTEQRSALPFVGIAASLILGGVLGFGAAFGLWQSEDTDWKRAIANYQVLYVPDTLAKAPDNLSEQTDRLAAFSEQIALDLTPGQTAEGLAFRRVQMLGFEGAPLVQMAYVDDAGTPFAFCITKVSDAAYTPKAEVIGGLAAAHWVENGYGFLVIGGDNIATVKALATNWDAQI